jgi:CRP/FNR family cyclic AMP-dependent transcriptional regulator
MTGAPTGVPTFESLTSLLSDRPRRRFARGARLYHEGDPPTHAFFVHDGLVKVVKTSDDGAEAVVEFRGSGDFVGERSVIDGLPRTTTAIAARDVSVTSVPSADFAWHLRHDADLAMTMVTSLANVVRHNIEHLLDLTVGDAVALVAVRLMQLVQDPIFDSIREDRNGTIAIEMPLSQHELASWAGVSHRSATAALGHLREQGHISTSRLHIEVRDPSALAEHGATRPLPAASTPHV